MYNTINHSLTLAQRLTLPTPKFFRVLRTIGLALLAASAAIVASPIAIPVIVTQVAGYVALAGTVVSAVSQTAVDNESATE